MSIEELATGGLASRRAGQPRRIAFHTSSEGHRRAQSSGTNGHDGRSAGRIGDRPAAAARHSPAAAGTTGRARPAAPGRSAAAGRRDRPPPDAHPGGRARPTRTRCRSRAPARPCRPRRPATVSAPARGRSSHPTPAPARPTAAGRARPGRRTPRPPEPTPPRTRGSAPDNRPPAVVPRRLPHVASHASTGTTVNRFCGRGGEESARRGPAGEPGRPRPAQATARRRCRRILSRMADGLGPSWARRRPRATRSMAATTATDSTASSPTSTNS